MKGAAWLRPTINLFSSRGPSSASPSHRRCLPQLLTGASFRSPWASSGSWQRSAPWIARLSPLNVPARSYRGGSVRDQRPTTTKRHLYVVLDDHLNNGFEIHKLDLHDDDDDLDANSGPTGTLLPRRLPDPPAVRVGPPLIGTRTQFAALGRSIIAMGSCAQDGVTVIYDTMTGKLAVSNLLPRALLYGGCDLAVAAGNRLYAFESRSDNFNNCHACTVCFPGGLHCLRAASLHPNAAAAADDVQWNWKLLPKSPWFSWSWNNTWPPELPFDAQSITAHAVHPRGGTIFVSAGGWRVDVGTFTYGTRSGKWKRRGHWVLPFTGQTHYDRDLDAWVGFHRPEASNNGRHDEAEAISGHVCACLATSAACASRRPPEWKVSRETLFQEDPDWMRINVQLVYMAERREYCLVEHLRQVEEGEGSVETKYVLRLTVFRVSYGKDGELVTTMAHRPSRLYEVPAYDEGFDTKAFWM